MTGKSRDHDENQTQFDESKQVSDFPKLSILKNRVRFLCSYVVEIDGLHFQERKRKKKLQNRSRKIQMKVTDKQTPPSNFSIQP